MLLGLRVENHRSLRDAQDFDLRPLYDKSMEAIPVAALYGANASGKSNLIDALIFIHDGVTGQNRKWSRADTIPRTPFLLNRACREAPSNYAVDLLLDGTPYTYGFSINNERVLREWLYKYSSKKKKTIVFEREGDEFTWGPDISKPHGEVLTELTPPNMLLLSIASRGKYTELRKVADWFLKSFWYANERNEPVRMEFTRRLLEEPESVKRLVRLLQHADLGISGIQVNVTDVPGKNHEDDESIVEFQTAEGSKIRVQITGDGSHEVTSRVIFWGLKSLLFTHTGEDPADIPLSDESRGTRTWFSLLGFAVEALDKGWTLAIDELDTSLHPILITHLIRIFQNPEVNTRGAQLIFTTHDASLLGRHGGSEILRRDEIWFVEKNFETGASTVYPLTAFHPRDGLNWERRYLGGSLGAIPFIDDEALAFAMRPPEKLDG